VSESESTPHMLRLPPSVSEYAIAMAQPYTLQYPVTPVTFVAPERPLGSRSRRVIAHPGGSLRTEIQGRAARPESCIANAL
jgi:hypothetical protein